MCSNLMFFFFFSSRRRHTRLQGDWSSDVCSSDLFEDECKRGSSPRSHRAGARSVWCHLEEVAGCDPAYLVPRRATFALSPTGTYRSEERRVGKECRSRWSPYH